MDILIDTQILIWSFDNNSPLSDTYKKLLEDTSNKIFVSQISLMELSIKKNINKLPKFIPDIEEIIQQIAVTGFEVLQLKDVHIVAYQYLPVFNEHRDPFDRFLIATAQAENLTIMTSDRKFDLYNSLIKII